MEKPSGPVKKCHVLSARESRYARADNFEFELSRRSIADRNKSLAVQGPHRTRVVPLTAKKTRACSEPCHLMSYSICDGHVAVRLNTTFSSAVQCDYYSLPDQLVYHVRLNSIFICDPVTRHVLHTSQCRARRRPVSLGEPDRWQAPSRSRIDLSWIPPPLPAHLTKQSIISNPPPYHWRSRQLSVTFPRSIATAELPRSPITADLSSRSRSKLGARD